MARPRTVKDTEGLLSLQVRMPASLFVAFRTQCDEDGVSMNVRINELVGVYMKEEKHDEGN